MSGFSWGLLGPGTLASERRTRTLGVAGSVRLFNDLAVPGLGGVWFAKPVFLATLGVHIAQQARARGVSVTNIEVANAIEALACSLAFNANGWTQDARLHGRLKLRPDADLAFRNVCRRGFYVTQPMRMSTVQVLPALGLVNTGGQRFNSFTCSPVGEEFVETCIAGISPSKRSVTAHLLAWICEKADPGKADSISRALSPTRPMNADAHNLLRERLRQGSSSEGAESRQRRSDALAWIDRLWKSEARQVGWQRPPAELQQADHWSDLQSGALFFTARSAALNALDAVETCMSIEGKSFSLKRELPALVATKLEDVRHAAAAFIARGHDSREALAFCRECTRDDVDEVLKNLIDRDGRVLRRIDDEVRAGPAFQGRAATLQEDESADESPEDLDGIAWPEGMSYRIRNLYLLNLDLHGKLAPRMATTVVGEDQQ